MKPDEIRCDKCMKILVKHEYIERNGVLICPYCMDEIPPPREWITLHEGDRERRV